MPDQVADQAARDKLFVLTGKLLDREAAARNVFGAMPCECARCTEHYLTGTLTRPRTCARHITAPS